MAILKQMFFWPYTSTAGDAGEFSTVPYTLGGAPGVVFYEPNDLAAALASIFADLTADPFTCSFNPATRRFVMAGGQGSPYSWDAGVLNATGVQMMGYTGSFDEGVTSNPQPVNACSNVWIPHATVINDPGDGYSEPDTGYNLSVSGRAKIWFEARHVIRPLHFDFLYPEEVFMEKETEQASLERLHKNGRARLRYWQNNAGTYTGDYVLHEDIVREFRPTRMDTQKELYGMDLTLRKYV